MHCELCRSDHSEDTPCRASRERATPVDAVRVPVEVPCSRRARPAQRNRVEPLARLGTWGVRVRHPEGVEAHGVELGRGGLFLHCAEPFPPLFTRLSLTLWLGGEEVPCEGEVVRHVDTAHARVWEVSPGIGVQLVSPCPRLRELFERVRGQSSASVGAPGLSGR